MRRITVTNGLFNDPERCSIRRRDLRLMRAVVRMAESKQYDIQKYLTGINRAVDALNAPEKRK